MTNNSQHEHKVEMQTYQNTQLRQTRTEISSNNESQMAQLVNNYSVRSSHALVEDDAKETAQLAQSQYFRQQLKDISGTNDFNVKYCNKYEQKEHKEHFSLSKY